MLRRKFVTDRIHISSIHIHIYRYKMKGFYRKTKAKKKIWIKPHWTIDKVEILDTKGNKYNGKIDVKEAQDKILKNFIEKKFKENEAQKLTNTVIKKVSK